MSAVIDKVLAIYLSPTGTTRKATRAIAEGMNIPVEDCDLTLPGDRRSFSHSFNNNEVAIVGLPVYAGRIPRNIDDFFSGLEGNGAPSVAVVVYGNRDYNDALIELKMMLEERGFSVKAGAAFIGEHTFSNNIATGRPDEDDLAIAAGFGRNALALMNEGITGVPELKGDYPFTWKGYDPANPGGHPTFFNIATNENCTDCYICVENCPWEAIDADDPRNIDSEKCMRCLRCLKNCPQEAKYIADDNFPAFLSEFEARLNAKRCEPELFLPG